MQLPTSDLLTLNSLEFKVNLNPNFEQIKYCLIWSDERPSAHLSKEGNELLNDLWIIRGFIHRKVPHNEWGFDPAYFKFTWNFALNNISNWPGFKRLSLSEQDEKYLNANLK